LGKNELLSRVARISNKPIKALLRNMHEENPYLSKSGSPALGGARSAQGLRAEYCVLGASAVKILFWTGMA
jgi:hypothetical protein